jgi:small subunit ribosomal protein S17
MAKKNGTRNIGLTGVEAPKENCSDDSCPFHGELGVRGRTFEGRVVSTKAAHTAVISWGRRLFVPKYERFEKRRSKVNAHIPPCMHIKTGDTVMIGECRPISKTKKFVVIKKMGESGESA